MSRRLRALIALQLVITVVSVIVASSVSLTVLDQAPQVDRNSKGVAEAKEQNADTIQCLRARGDRDRCLGRVQAKIRRGRPGKAGAPGTQGRPGEAGPQGSAGSPGTEGRSGARGRRGERGPQGIQGVSGQKGDRGDPGTSVTITAPVPPPRTGPPQYPLDRPRPEPRPQRPPTITGPTGPPGPQGPRGEPATPVISIETACPTGLLGGLTPSIATDSDGDGVYTCPQP